MITRYRDTNSNLRTQLNRIIRRAGLEPWPKLFQNLRSTRETELAEQFPIHVVCDWIGNSKAVALKNYLQVTDGHFEKATQNPTQTVHDTGDLERQRFGKSSRMSEETHNGNSCQPLPIVKVGRAGLEPATKGL